MEKSEAFIFEKLPELIDHLDQSRAPKFGKMSPQHMIEHLGGIFLISSGMIKIQSPSKEQVDKYYSWFQSDEFAFQPNTSSPAMPEELPQLRFDDFKEAVKAMKKAVDKFRQHFSTAPHEKVTHPVFGPLSYEEWIKFHEEHSRHHLRQFGLL